DAAGPAQCLGGGLPQRFCAFPQLVTTPGQHESSARAAYRTHAAQHLVQGDELGRVDLAACRVWGDAPTEVLAHLTDHSGGDVTDLGEGDALCRQIEKSL